MSDVSVHSMSLLVGEIRGELRGLAQSIDSLNRVWGERENAASEGRRLVHEKVDALRLDMQRVSAEVANVAEDIVTLKPTVESLKLAKSERAGMGKVGKAVWGLLIAISGGGVAEVVNRIFR